VKKSNVGKIHCNTNLFHMHNKIKVLNMTFVRACKTFAHSKILLSTSHAQKHKHKALLSVGQCCVEEQQV